MTTMMAMTTKEYETRWLRPDKADRPEQLVESTDIGRMAGVEPRTIRAWAAKYDHFPRPVKEVRTGPGCTRFYLAEEVASWLLLKRPRLVGKLPERKRMRLLVSAYMDEINDAQDALDRLRAQQDALIAALAPDTPHNP